MGVRRTRPAWRHAAPAAASAVLLALLGPGTATWAASSSTSDEPATVTCARDGTVILTPGLTMTAQDFTFTELGRLGPCVGSDGSMMSGTVRVTDGGRGTGTCSGIELTAPFSVEWDDGSTSTGEAAATSAGAVVLATGEIISGRFAGKSFSTYPVVSPHNPELCLSSGITEVDYYGEIVFE